MDSRSVDECVCAKDLMPLCKLMAPSGAPRNSAVLVTSLRLMVKVDTRMRVSDATVTMAKRTFLRRSPLVSTSIPAEAVEAASADAAVAERRLMVMLGEDAFIWKCLDDKFCPGGAPGSCGPNMVGYACTWCDSTFRMDSAAIVSVAAVLPSSSVFLSLPL